jgi:hypothetical protein
MRGGWEADTPARRRIDSREIAVTRQLARLTSTLALLAGLTAGAEAAPLSFTFALDPESGAVAGAPGRTVGWGFTLRNQDPANWLEVYAIDADPFAFGDPEPLSFPIVGPGTTVVEAFVRNVQGLFQVTIDRDAPLGPLDSGVFQVFVQWYDGDPLSGGQLLEPLQGMVETQAAYSVVARAAVPEPATILLVGLVAGAAVRHGRRHRTRAR